MGTINIYQFDNYDRSINLNANSKPIKVIKNLTTSITDIKFNSTS